MCNQDSAYVHSWVEIIPKQNPEYKPFKSVDLEHLKYFMLTKKNTQKRLLGILII